MTLHGIINIIIHDLRIDHLVVLTLNFWVVLTCFNPSQKYEPCQPIIPFVWLNTKNYLKPPVLGSDKSVNFNMGKNWVSYSLQ